MSDKFAELLERVKSATGADRALDREIAQCFDAMPGEPRDAPNYTSSTDLCIDLVHRVLPGWHWHVGYGPRGILPYASLYTEHQRYEAIAGTVPLALLSALLQARSSAVKASANTE